MKDWVYTLIRNSPQLRKLIADELGVIESSIYQYAVRKSPSLERPFIMKLISEFTKKPLEDLK